MVACILVSIFGLVSLVKGKKITCLENQQNYNSDLANSNFTCDLMREHPPWWSRGVGAGGGGGCAPRRRMHNHISYNINILTIVWTKLNNYTTFMLFNLMLTVKPCRKLIRG